MNESKTKIIVETQRFYLREINMDDASDLLKLDSDVRVHQYLGNNTVESEEEIHKMISRIMEQYDLHGIGRWAVIEKTERFFLGWAGLKKVTETVNGFKDYYDLGYRLLPAYWGKGVATECAEASLEYGFSNMGLKEILAAAHIENEASNRILIKCGFKAKGRFTHFGALQNWYEIKEEEWIERKKSR